MTAPEAYSVSEWVSEDSVVSHATGEGHFLLPDRPSHFFRFHEVPIYVFDLKHSSSAPMPNMFHFREATACAPVNPPNCIVQFWHYPNFEPQNVSVEFRSTL